MPSPNALSRPSTVRLLRLRRTGAGLVAALAGAVGAATVVASPAQATPWPGHPDRSIVRHTVKSGESASGLAVRYHAWTAELIRLNRLGRAGTIRQGQVLRIPVVVSAARRAGGRSTVQRPRATRARAGRVLIHRTTPPTRAWRHHRMSRAQVRSLVVRMARHYGVPPKLALAVAWQESGWQQRRVSSAGALGVMQVMPDTGRWMRWYAGRPLRLRDTHDNVRAGILTLRVLRASTRRDNRAIAAYYQGLGAVRRHGFFDDTRVYVRSVRAHERRITRTGSPV